MEIIDANVCFGFWPQRRLQSDLEQVKKLAAEHRISRMLVCSIRGIFADFTEGNRETLSACWQDPNLIPVATVNPLRYFGVADEIETMFASGVKAFRFFPQEQHWPYEFAPFHRVLQQLDAHGALVILPARVGGHQNYGVLTALARLAERYDKLKFLITGIFYGNLAEVLVVGEDYPNLYFETHLLNSPDGIEVCTAELGADRLVYGSQTPFHYIASSLPLVLAAQISDEAKAQILSKNILRLLGVAS